jgi:hypothetical protein
MIPTRAPAARPRLQRSRATLGASIAVLVVHATPAAASAGCNPRQEARSTPAAPVTAPAAAVAAAPATPGAVRPRTAVAPRPGQLFAGFFSSGFEVEAFRACGVDEAWWVASLDPELGARYREIARTAYQPVYAVFRGEPSEKGPTGHLGRYDRLLRVDDVVELRLARDDDCRPARRGGGWISTWEASGGAALNPLSPLH